MQKSLISILIVGMLAMSDTQAEDLIQMYQRALVNDATYASARSSLSATLERVPQAKSQLLPNVGFNANYLRNTTDISPRNEGQIVLTPSGGLGLATSTNILTHSTTYSLALSQPLFRWDRWQSFEQSKLAQSIGEAQFAQAQQDLIINLSQAYFNVLAAQDTLELTLAQKAATTEQLATAKLNYQVGTQTIVDTHEAQAAFDLVVAQEIAASDELENRRSSLRAIIGKSPGELSPLRPGVNLVAPSPATIDSWVTSAESQNYTVRTAEFVLETAKREIKKSRAGNLPTVDLVSNIGRQNSSNTMTTKAIGVNLSIPIFSGYAVTSRVRETIALEDKARNDLEAARRGATQMASQAFRGVNSGMAQVKALEAAEVSSQSSLESNKLGYQVGVRINIDVLNAQRQLFSTRANLAKARYDTIMSGLRLKAAVGSLKEEDLMPVNAMLGK